MSQLISVESSPLPGRDMDSQAHTYSAPITPIDRLPLETLLDIFAWAVGARNPLHSTTVEYYANLRILRLVGRTWYRIIDRAPEFWVYIDPFVAKRRWRMAARKSQDMLINVDCLSHCRTPATKSLPQAFMQELGALSLRVGSLWLTEMDVDDMMRKGVAMPRLASLRLRDQPTLQWELRDSSWAMALVNWAPNVRNVELEACSFSWPDSGYANLDSLSIQHDDAARGFDTVQISRILAASPQLKFLDLRGRITEATLTKTPLPEIHLPELETLRIAVESTVTSFQILDSIIATPAEEFNVTIGPCPKTVSQDRFRMLGRFANGLRKCQSDQTLEIARTPKGWAVSHGGFSTVFHPGGCHKKKVSKRFRCILEELGERRLKPVVRLKIILPSLIPLISTLCPSIRFLHVGDLITPLNAFNLFSLLRLGNGVTHSGWLLPYISDISVVVDGGYFLKEMAKLIRARAEAHAKGQIYERISRLTIRIRLPKKSTTQKPEWTEGILDLFPDLVVSIE